MADNRNFVNKFANEGGGDIFVEDARLSESTSTTTVTTEGLLLKGTDGAYYEIDKASLSEVIRAELGAILADNSKNNGTSVGKVPTLNSTGNALGASSVADLATVLGVGVEVRSGSANSILTPGIYNIKTNSVSDVPQPYGVIFVYGNPLVQLYLSDNYDGTFLYVRWGSGLSTGWKSWHQITLTAV